MCYSALVRRDLKYLEQKFGAIAVREQFDGYELETRQNPKSFPPLADRIYPGHYAPVLRPDARGLIIEPMRYGAYPPPSVSQPNRFTTYNARRDNLKSSFWSEAFMLHHGFVVLSAFYEWVAVRDLLAAGVVSMPEVKEAFRRQAEERRTKLLASGKKHKPTATELKEAEQRQIVIEFAPANHADLLVPVIFSSPGPGRLSGFAMVTDDPPLDVSSAGHDRCPITLNESRIRSWMQLDTLTQKELIEMLGRKEVFDLRHRLAPAV